MRTAFLLLALLLCRAPVLASQTSLAAAPMDPRLIPTPASLADAPSVAPRRDRVVGAVQGAVQGAALGALIGGLGFAAVTYVGNGFDSDAEGYAVLALPVGGVVGGALGLVAGAIIGAPERDEEPRAQVLVSPGPARGVTASVSVPLGPRPR
jgi:MFS family permease